MLTGLLGTYYVCDLCVNAMDTYIFNNNLLVLADDTRRVAVSRTHQNAARMLSDNSLVFINVCAKFNVIAICSGLVSVIQIAWTTASFFKVLCLPCIDANSARNTHCKYT